METSQSVCIFCGASAGLSRVHAEATSAFVTALVRRGHHIVFGGGGVGLMGVVADACLEAGGKATGVIPQDLEFRELAHRGLTRLIKTRDITERKQKMAELSDCFVALPGGLGTLEEFSEVFSHRQLGIHDKPLALLNVDGFYDPLIAFFDHAVTSGFVRKTTRDLLIVDDDPQRLATTLSSPVPPAAAG